jgi:hypothetical protein
MGVLGDNIRKAVGDGRYAFGSHANIRLRQRRIMGWHVVAAMEGSRLVVEREDGAPFPVAEFEGYLPDGTAVKVVWAWISESQTAKLVTVHYFPRAATWD